MKGSKIKNSISKENLKKDILNNGLRVNLPRWNFDIRPLLLSHTFRSHLAILFWNKFEKYYPFQLLGVEFSGIPMSIAIQDEGFRRGFNCNVLIYRKTKESQTNKNLIEGYINTEKIIYIDDILSSGKSLEKVLFELNKQQLKIFHSFYIVNFERLDCKLDIKNYSIFLLQDFGLPEFELVD